MECTFVSSLKNLSLEDSGSTYRGNGVVREMTCHRLNKNLTGTESVESTGKEKMGFTMRKVRKKEEKIIYAYRLGAGSEVERTMILEGKIRKTADGSYEIFSSEAHNGTGEQAKPGDYFKVDGLGNPYPNEKEWFEARHVLAGANCYRQKLETYDAWEVGDPVSEPLQYLLDQHLLKIQTEDTASYFTAKIWGTELTAARDAVLVFYQIERDKTGMIRDVDFNLVARSEFERTYEYVAD